MVAICSTSRKRTGFREVDTSEINGRLGLIVHFFRAMRLKRRILRPRSFFTIETLIVVDPIPMLADKAMGANFTYTDWKARQGK